MKVKIWIVGLIFIVGVSVYLAFVKRHFIYSRDESKVITIWPVLGNTCYIIPGKYFGLVPPETNYIKTVTHKNYIAIVWEPIGASEIQMSIYNEFKPVGLDSSIALYKDQNELLRQYSLVEMTRVGESQKKDGSTEITKREINYEYIDLNRVYGIKIFTW
jgi:hypothetical protein